MFFFTRLSDHWVDPYVTRNRFEKLRTSRILKFERRRRELSVFKTELWFLLEQDTDLRSLGGGKKLFQNFRSVSKHFHCLFEQFHFFHYTSPPLHYEFGYFDRLNDFRARFKLCCGSSTCFLPDSYIRVCFWLLTNRNSAGILNILLYFYQMQIKRSWPSPLPRKNLHI